MRMLMNITMPAEPFNTEMRKGNAGKAIGRILEAIKPEAAYFTEQDGHRGAILVIQVGNASEIPTLAEPWYLTFNAECKFRIAMTPEDLQHASMEELAKVWG